MVVTFRIVLLALGLSAAFAGAVGVKAAGAGDRLSFAGQIDARPPVLPVAVPSLCKVTVVASGASTAICRSTAPNPLPPRQTTILTNIACGPTLPYTGKGTLIVQKNGDVQLECHVPA